MSDRRFVTSLLTPMAALFDPTTSDGARRSAEVAAVTLMHYFFRMMKQQTGSADGMLGRLVSIHAADSLSLEELLVSCVLLAHASFENTTNFLSFAAAEVLGNPEARTEMTSRSATQRRRCLDELLRLASPARILMRMASGECQLDGEAVVPGTHVLALVAAANRDPHQFDDADSFRVDPSSRTNLSFGAGVHACLGTAVARREAEVALVRLADYCNGDIEPTIVEWKDNAVMFGPRELRVRIVR